MGSHSVQLCLVAGRSAVSILALLWPLSLLTAPVYAQPSRAPGLLQGLVTDPLGGAVVAALVAVIDASNLRHEVETDGQGRYRFEKLPPGNYSLDVSAPGFLPYTTFVDVGGGLASPSATSTVS